MAFPPDFLEQLRERVSLVDVVSRHVKLQRRGREYVGLSPFKQERTPSFTVVPDKGFFHCFSSGEHGDVIGFLMRLEGLSFPEAVEKLAQAAGLEVPRETPEASAQAHRRRGLLEAVEAAAAFYERQLRLPAGRRAMDYLRGRGARRRHDRPLPARLCIRGFGGVDAGAEARRFRGRDPDRGRAAAPSRKRGNAGCLAAQPRRCFPSPTGGGFR